MSELDNWIKIIEKHPETAWPKFYKSTTGHAVSNKELLEYSVIYYGFWPTFEAIIAAGRKKLDDPLPYVLSVAQSKWKDGFMRLSNEGSYSRGIQRAKERTIEQNAELEEKLRKAKGK